MLPEQSLITFTSQQLRCHSKLDGSSCIVCMLLLDANEIKRDAGEPLWHAPWRLLRRLLGDRWGAIYIHVEGQQLSLCTGMTRLPRYPCTPIASMPLSRIRADCCCHEHASRSIMALPRPVMVRAFRHSEFFHVQSMAFNCCCRVQCRY